MQLYRLNVLRSINGKICLKQNHNLKPFSKFRTSFLRIRSKVVRKSDLANVINSFAHVIKKKQLDNQQENILIYRILDIKNSIKTKMFTLWSLIEASMLCLNAVCILHEERFLAKGMQFYINRINKDN